MRVPVDPGDGGARVFLMFKYDSGHWRWRGWGDERGKMLAEAGTGRCVELTNHFADMMLTIAKAMGVVSQEPEPIEPPDGWQEEAAEDLEKMKRDYGLDR